MFLVMVDAHSKWPELIEMKSTTAEQTIKVMRNVFARNGLPKQIVSDSGPQFISESFALFMKRHGILHVRTATAKPSSNGLVERFNATFKTSIRAMQSETNDLNVKMNNFLLTYRNSVHSTTNETPAKMFLGRDLRNRLDLIKPDVKQRVTNQQTKMSVSSGNKFRELELGQRVLARDYRPTAHEKWIHGTIVSRDGPLLYKVDVGNATWKRHIDQLLATDLQQTPIDIAPQFNSPDSPSLTEIEEGAALLPTPPLLNNSRNVNETVTSPEGQVVKERRYPLRNRRAPDRLRYE